MRIPALEKAIRGDKPAALADTYDEDVFPYGAQAGVNNGDWNECPFCGKPPTNTKFGKAFLFTDELSAKEYKISGLCQACQDKTFGATTDG